MAGRLTLRKGRSGVAVFLVAVNGVVSEGHDRATRSSCQSYFVENDGHIRYCNLISGSIDPDSRTRVISDNAVSYEYLCRARRGHAHAIFKTVYYRVLDYNLARSTYFDT